jgi:subtilisin family serine protease
MRFFKQRYRVKSLFKALVFAILPVSLGLALSFLLLHTYQGFAGTREYEKTYTTGGRDEGSVFFLNDRARAITGAAAVGAPGFIVPEGLTGEGQIVAVADSGLDLGRLDDLHPDLQSTPGKMPKVVMLKSWAGRSVPDDPDGHGTHMAATIAGTGAASGGQFQGIAPGASIYFQSILDADGKPAPPANLADLFWPAYAAGARVHVDGWGGGPNAYRESASQVDGFVRKYPDFLTIFGAGNSGPSPRTITDEANSKNALVVGASVLPRPALAPGSHTGLPADFSSRGPAGDGRIKPEIYAPGSSVVSARSRLTEGNLPGYPEYTRMQGTSMAAAVAGGGSALLMEYFKKNLELTTPSAALVKAALINGAIAMEGGPSERGFGIMDLAGTIIALKDGSFQFSDEWAGVAQGDEIVFKYTVKDESTPFKATLTWTDPAAEPGSAQTLVNDVNLIVETPGGSIYYGNHFLGKNAPDRINNVEQVVLSAPQAGEYTLRVSGATIRRNTVSGSIAPVQDYALVWGQTSTGGLLKEANGNSLTLEDGTTLESAETPVVNLVDETVAPADSGHLFPGALVYRTLERIYVVAGMWREAGAKAIKTAEGYILSELNPSKRLGGYLIAAENGITVNGEKISPDKLPQGVEVSGVINPFNQKLYQVRAAYTELEGVVSALLEEDGERKLFLGGGSEAYRISPEAVFSYEDNYVNAETVDLPFGTGALEELEEVLPGMPVRLHLAPSTGEVQYLAVKRQVALGTVSETSVAHGEIRLESGAVYRLLTGSPVKKDRKKASFSAIKPKDYVALMVLPDTGETIGMVAYSKVFYGKAVNFSEKTRTLDLLNDNGQYLSLNLPPEAVIYRWGARATKDAIAAGSRVRVTTDPGLKEVWRLDLAQTLHDRGRFSEYNAGTGRIATLEGKEYLVSGSTRFLKNGYPVEPEDLHAGEQLELEYAASIPTSGSVLISVNARASARPPELFVSVLPLPERVVITGRTGAGYTLYLRGAEGFQEKIPVDQGGRFTFTKKRGSKEEYRNLVVVDPRTGGVSGRKLKLPGWNGGAGSFVSGVMNGVLARSRNLTGDSGNETENFYDTPLKRAEAAAVLAGILNWPADSGANLKFTDVEAIPQVFHYAVAEVQARGIFKGDSDGSFVPGGSLSRSQAAVILAAVLRDLGIPTLQTAGVDPYLDYAGIPAWAAPAVAETTALGLLRGRPDGTFAPSDAITAGEMVLVLERLLNYCQNYYAAVPMDKEDKEEAETVGIVETADLTTTPGAGMESRRRAEHLQ